MEADDSALALEVLQRHRVAEDVCVLVLRDAAGGQLPRWEPGAHVDLHLAPGLVRQYSLCGDPADTSRWEAAVLLEADSRGGSRRAHALAPGSRLLARGPRNHFPLERAEEYLFLAGGIGITPLVPMIAEVAARKASSWRLVYGGRKRSAMAFADHLVGKYDEHVTLLPEDEHGRLPLVELIASTGPATATYCCGPSSLITAAEEAHAVHGMGTLHVERFVPKDAEATADDRSFEVEAASSGKVVTVSPGQTVLDALRGADVQVLSSCTEGICGTCETFVLSGRPDHRDSILSPAERDASATMFPCVSRSLSARLVLDV